MSDLRISKDLSLPLDTVTSTLIVYGGKGMGKTVFGAVLAEELYKNSLRWAWLDPLGVSWGIRHSADGNGPGVECLILGGTHGDIPIEPDGGAAVADVVVEENVNVLVDFSRKPSGEMWGVAERIRFATAYARRLFQRQGDMLGGRRREPLMQILDEGARYIPQVVPAGNPELSKCIAAWQQFVEEGRNVGLGLCVLTQRSARINKDVAELADAMIAFRTVGPNSLGAVLDWLGEHVAKTRAKELSGQVRQLPRGSALIVSPGWLEEERVVAVRMRETFVSSDTPKPGQRQRTARGDGAKPDLARIRERMAATIERARADDPKALRARVTELERQLAERETETERVEVPMFDEEAFGELQRSLTDGLSLALGNAKGALHTYMSKCLAAAEARPGSLIGKERRTAPQPVPERRGSAPSVTATPSPRTAQPRDSAIRVGLTKGQSTVLVAVAQQREGADRTQLSIITGYRRSTRDRLLQELHAKHCVSHDGALIRITDVGHASLPLDWKPLPTGKALREYWLERLPAGNRAVLEVAIRSYPRAVSREAISAATEYKRSTRDRLIQELKARRLLVDAPGGAVKASEGLF